MNELTYTRNDQVELGPDVFSALTTVPEDICARVVVAQSNIELSNLLDTPSLMSPQ